MNLKISDVWLFVAKNWLDLLLFAGFVAGSLLFASRAYRSADESAASPVAYLSSGTGNRYERGGSQFMPAPIGTAFYNMDAIWVGPSQTATLTASDGVSLALSERTLVILRKPFRRNAPPEQRFRVVAGSAKLTQKTEVKIIQAPPRFSEIPDDVHALEAAQQPNSQDLKSYPTPAAIILTTGSKEADVPFTWAKPVSGYLVVKSAGDALPVQYLPLNDESYHHASLKPGFQYVWQVIDSSRTPVVGPFIFELRQSNGQLKALVNSTASRPQASPPVDVKIQQ